MPTALFAEVWADTLIYGDVFLHRIHGVETKYRVVALIERTLPQQGLLVLNIPCRSAEGLVTLPLLETTRVKRLNRFPIPRKDPS